METARMAGVAPATPLVGEPSPRAVVGAIGASDTVAGPDRSAIEGPARSPVASGPLAPTTISTAGPGDRSRCSSDRTRSTASSVLRRRADAAGGGGDSGWTGPAAGGATRPGGAGAGPTELGSW